MKRLYSEQTFRIIIFFIFILLSACTQSTSDEVIIQEMKTTVEYLASDELEGRETGTTGEKEAAKFIAQKFESLGLTPAGETGYMQVFDVKPSKNPHEAVTSTDDTDSSGIQGTNVLGLLDNKGNQLMVIGAHYDHLGYGGFGSLHRGDSGIHNGADDNASGVAVMLALAKMLRDQDLKSDILFMAFSGEEKGLWGSNYFTKNPTVELPQVRAMINMDMVGRMSDDKKLVIHGTGTSPEWENIINNNNTDSLQLILKPSGVGPSDHTSFYLQNIPVLHFFTGQHEDYHKPSDDFEKLNYEGMLSVSKLISRVVKKVDDLDSLSFTKTKDPSESTPKFKVTLGVVPDYLYSGKGMKIDGVSEGKPAAEAGLQKGDVVVRLGEIDVTDMMSYMKALSKFSNGDTTKVVVRRGAEELTFDVTF